MDGKLMLFVTTIWVCGGHSISSKLPTTLAGNLSEALENRKKPVKYPMPHDVHTYDKINTAKEDSNAKRVYDAKSHLNLRKNQKNECPLCEENFGNRKELNDHALFAHEINPEVFARLLSFKKGYDLLPDEQKRTIAIENEDSANPSADRSWRKVDYIQPRKDDFSVQYVLDNMALRYSANLQNIEWVDILDQVLPFISHYRKTTILHICGQFSINPILVLGKIIQNQNIKPTYNLKSDEEFRNSIKAFANTLSHYALDFDSKGNRMNISALEYSLNQAFNNNDWLVNDFLLICGTISKRYDIFKTAAEANSQIYLHARFNHDEDEKIDLQLPFASTECWQLGATHFGALESEISAVSNGRMSSIDMAPYLFQRWGVPFDFVNSNGDIYAAHGGYFKKHSDCSVEIRHDKSDYSTYYSHLVPTDIQDNVFVESGENIGRISLDPDTSNCKCDWSGNSFLCATGPHLHFELRYKESPAKLDGRTISNLRIKAGLLPHDSYCSDPEDCTSATFEGKSCATYYTDLTTGDVICAVTKRERNMGGGYSYGRIAFGIPGNLGTLINNGSYLCKKFKCQSDISLTENIDWGYHNDTDGTKHDCQLKCSKSHDCGAYEWSDAPDKKKCVWWKKESCQQTKDDVIDDPKFVTCTKIEYNFKQVNNTICIPRGDEFTTIDGAKNECKQRSNCKGILHPDCRDSSNYYICNTTAITGSDNYIKSCFYRKYRMDSSPKTTPSTITTSTTTKIASTSTTTTTSASTTTTLTTTFDLEYLDEMNGLLDQLLISQNLSNSKLSQLIRILELMKNLEYTENGGTGSPPYKRDSEGPNPALELRACIRGLHSSHNQQKINCKPTGNPRCNPETWNHYEGYSDGCCSKEEKCTIGEGDCNFHDECIGSLVCVPNSCPKSNDKSKKFHPRASCCKQPSGEYIFEYNFVKIIDTDCSLRGDVFPSLEEAKKECKINKQCQGVLNTPTATDTQTYHLCHTNATTSTDNNMRASLFKKIILDPCNQIVCNGTNAVCQVVYDTGKPFCACAEGFRGDPKVKCVPDGSDFLKYEKFYCKSYYQNESSLVTAISNCRHDANCSMVSAFTCDNKTSEYRICGKSPELIARDEACYFRKKITHCSDFVLNGDETGVDCGGSCEPCQVLIKVKLQAMEEASGISWRVQNTNCKSNGDLQLRRNRVYQTDCTLVLGQSYTLECNSLGNGWWKSNHLIIENHVYCEHAMDTTILNITISGVPPQQCPPDFPYVFDFGKACCAYGQDGQGNTISIRSGTCLRDMYRPCVKDRCAVNTDDQRCAVEGETYNPSTKRCQCGSANSCAYNTNTPDVYSETIDKSCQQNGNSSSFPELAAAKASCFSDGNCIGLYDACGNGNSFHLCNFPPRIVDSDCGSTLYQRNVCVYDWECPGFLLCDYGVCRAPCGSDNDCFDGYTCVVGYCELICKTDTGKLCVFPFNYVGVTYISCTTADFEGTYWCATGVDSNRNYNGKWGVCGAACSQTHPNDGTETTLPATISHSTPASTMSNTAISAPTTHIPTNPDLTSASPEIASQTSPAATKAPDTTKAVCIINEDCSGGSDTCTAGRCMCGKHDECPSPLICAQKEGMSRCIECKANKDCSGASDTCKSSICYCGSKEKCTGKSDTCKAGQCKCGDNNECSSTEFCVLGKCKRSSFYTNANSANYCHAAKSMCECSATNENCNRHESCHKIRGCEKLGLQISGSCKGTYGSSNFITSPNYPQNYGNDIDCRWTISSPVETTITLTVLEFETEAYQDELKIYEGKNIHGNLVTTYSGSSLSPFVSTGHGLYLRFTSDGGQSYPGFKIEVSGAETPITTTETTTPVADEGLWQTESENKWCNYYDWDTTISTQIECQNLCLNNRLCIGISYSHRRGLTNTCFMCKSPFFDSSPYGFAFYRRPECSIDDDCTGNSDTCVSNYCQCGSNVKCSGRADSSETSNNCRSGICKCGESEECSGEEFCILGECREYKKVSSTWCYRNYGDYSSLTSAKLACTSDSNCQAIYDQRCNDAGAFTLCPNSTIFEYSSYGSCIYSKVPCSTDDPCVNSGTCKLGACSCTDPFYGHRCQYR